MQFLYLVISFYLLSTFTPANWVLAMGKGFPDRSSQSGLNPIITYPTDESGLIFANEVRYASEDSSYTDFIQLQNLNGVAQALQFRIQLNKVEDDSTILIFQNLEKGSDISSQNWVVNFNIIKGNVLPNGASKDEVLVLLYSLNQNGGLQPGDYYNLQAEDRRFDLSCRVKPVPHL